MAPEAKAHSGRMQKHPLRILLIDNDTTLLDVLGKLIKRAGYVVYATDDEQKGVDIFKENNDIWIVIAELQFHRSSGITLGERLTRLRPGVQVIILTAYGTIQSAKEAMRRGLADYITKPFPPGDLFKAIKKCERTVERREDLEKSHKKVLRDIEEAQATLRKALTSRASEIKRSITFPPEFKEAGVAILSYFSHVLAVKYPDTNVGVTIEQLGNRVTLIVATPEGEKERVERELNNYGLVVKGRLMPEQYFDSPYEVMALKHKLELAALEVRQTKDMLYSERRQYGARIHSLEKHMETLGDVLSMDRHINLELIRALREIAKKSTKAAAESINNIVGGIQKGITEDDREFITQQLLTIRKEDTTLIGKIERLLLKGAVQGAAGNFLFAWLQSLPSLFI